jgi:hypothetical protein
LAKEHHLLAGHCRLNGQRTPKPYIIQTCNFRGDIRHLRDDQNGHNAYSDDKDDTHHDS